MVEVGDLEQYVELHPRDYQQRWRLAKKLYTGGNYAAALEHLDILRREWVPKVNVSRYLAATSYRLGQFEQAIAELESAIQEWPTDISIREQLARVLEMAGRREGASAVWRDILRLSPEYDSAQDAVERLPSSMDVEYTPPEGSAVGVANRSGVMCPNCRTLNTNEFERCWKCQTLLASGNVNTPPPEQVEVEVKPSARLAIEAGQSQRQTMAFIGAFLAVLGLGVYLTLRGYDETSISTAALVERLFDADLLSARVMMGITLLVAWPFALWLAFVLIRHETASLRPVIMTGMLLAAVMYAGLWVPFRYMGYVYIGLVAASFAPIVLVFKPRLARAFGAWGIQGLIVTVAMAASFTGAEGTAVIKEFPTAYSVALAHSAVVERYVPSPSRLPAELRMTWVSTGSSWLDEKFGNVVFEISIKHFTSPLAVELHDEASTLFYRHMDKSPFIFHWRISPERSVDLVVRGNGSAEVNVVAYSLLKPRVGT